MLIQTNQATTPNIQTVDVVFVDFVGLSNIFHRVVNVSVSERAPSQMLVHHNILLIQRKSSLITSLCLLKIFLLLIEQANFDQNVNLLFGRKLTGHNRVLKEANRLINLVRFRIN